MGIACGGQNKNKYRNENAANVARIEITFPGWGDELAKQGSSMPFIGPVGR